MIAAWTRTRFRRQIIAAAFVQGTGLASSGSVASLSKSFTSNCTAGNAIAVGAICNGANLNTTCIADDNLNTYATGRAIEDGTAVGCAQSGGWYAKNINGGITTVTLTPTSSDFCGIVIAEFSGIDTVAPLDNGGSVTVNPGQTFYNTSSYTLTRNGARFGIMEQNEGDTAIAADGGHTQIFENENSVGQMPFNGEYIIDSAGSGKIGSWSLGAARKGTAISFGLMEPAAGGTSGIAHLWTTKGWIF